MANPNITNNDPRKLEVFDPKYEEAILLFAGTDTKEGMSKTAMYFIGGLMRHARALIAFTNPTTNS